MDLKPTITREEKSMNQVRQKSMKTFEDSYAEPPPYTSQPPSAAASFVNGPPPKSSVPAIEDLNFQRSPLEIPTPAECIAHLKLIHALAKLRHDVGNYEGLYGISMEKMDIMTSNGQDGGPVLSSGLAQQPGGIHDENGATAAIAAHAPINTTNVDAALAEQVRDKRWSIFVHKAVDRFEKWWETLPTTYTSYSAIFRTPITTSQFDSSYAAGAVVNMFPTDGEGYEDLRLPPLDVLMVWHSHMLNPRTYLEDSIRYTKHALWRTAFPWRDVYESIDDESFEYSRKEADAFLKQTGRPWNPLDDESLKVIKCPKCTATKTVSWTRPPASSTPEAMRAFLSEDTGFSGQSFYLGCACGSVITHERLRVGKFQDDAMQLLENRRPLPGTILSAWGEPQCTSRGKSIVTHDPFFPNRVVETRPEFRPHALREISPELTVEGLKVMFQEVLKNRVEVAYINAAQRQPSFVAKTSRIAVRKMLSHYWDNSSVFGLDLVGAVMRQGTFVQKMAKLDWLHSPSVVSTTQRLIVKYHRFVLLSADSPGKTVVPTLDVDLAWHTHQLSPKIYYRYTMSETKKFLNHDDKIPEVELGTAFQATSLAYEKKYGQPYSECSCWYYECTREPLRSNFLNKFSSRRSSLSIDRLDEKRFSKDPHTGVHLSAHNALVVNDAHSAALKRRELEDLDLQYAKVCKRYQKKKMAGDAPARNTDAMMYSAYGYPMYYPMPIYVPYYADPAVGDGHANVGHGGSCAAGTCAASTSLGSCSGGEGTPGCVASCGGHGNVAAGCGTCGGGGGGGSSGGDGGGDGGGGGGGCGGGCGGGS